MGSRRCSRIRDTRPSRHCSASSCRRPCPTERGALHSRRFRETSGSSVLLLRTVLESVVDYSGSSEGAHTSSSERKSLVSICAAVESRFRFWVMRYERTTTLSGVVRVRSSYCSPQSLGLGTSRRGMLQHREGASDRGRTYQVVHLEGRQRGKSNSSDHSTAALRLVDGGVRDDVRRQPWGKLAGAPTVDKPAAVANAPLPSSVISLHLKRDSAHLCKALQARDQRHEWGARREAGVLWQCRRRLAHTLIWQIKNAFATSEVQVKCVLVVPSTISHSVQWNISGGFGKVKSSVYVQF
jgi:hypothetical protein